MMKVIVKTSNDDELMRTVGNAAISDVCAVVSALVELVERQREESVVKISVHEQRHVEVLSSLPPVVANICGKIVHNSALHIYHAGVRPYVVRQRNNFGVFDCVFTRACNFHTGSNKTSTMFRAGIAREDIRETIAHVFVEDAVHEVLVNNVVYTSRLGHPVSRYNNGIRRALEHLSVGCVEACMAIDDCMFVHCLLVQVQSAEYLAGFGLADVPSIKVRINVCRTGVVNFFFGLAGGVPLHSAPEERLRLLCAALLETVASAV